MKNLQPRDLRTVLISILTQIPVTEDLHTIIISRLESVEYAAPEMLSFWWNEIADDLNDHVPVDPTKLKPWQKVVVEIFRGERLDG
jgi:hypothetical protein